MVFVVRYYSDLSFYNVNTDGYSFYIKLFRSNNVLIKNKLYKRCNKIVNKIVLA
jgi:hypothetical protein